MDKLIELLNEWIREERNELSSTIGEPVDVGIYEYDKLEECITYDGYGVSDYYIISKEAGFIKWLVENNKIDRLTFCTIETPSSKYEDFDLGPETPREDYTNILLMDLAIQEKPIEFLISILK